MCESNQRQANAFEITPAMIEAGVSALYQAMGYQLSGSVVDGVSSVLEVALRSREISCADPKRSI